MSRSLRPGGWIAIGLAAACVAAGCTYPQDPRGSLATASGGTLDVAAVEHAPWVDVHDDGSVTGVEARLVERFAEEIDAEVAWHPTDGAAAVEALRRGSVDVAIGGFGRRSPLGRHVGTTRAYVSTKVVLARPPDSRESFDVEGRDVLHDAASIELAALIRAEDADPNPTEQLPPRGVAAAHDWEVRAWKYDVGPELHKVDHVLFVEPGENRLTSRLERFLDTQRARVLAELAEAAA